MLLFNDGEAETPPSHDFATTHDIGHNWYRRRDSNDNWARFP